MPSSGRKWVGLRGRLSHVHGIPAVFLRWIPDGCSSAGNLSSEATTIFALRWSMACPRCNRSRIERYGENTRCAVCGMPYNPNDESCGEFVASSLFPPPEAEVQAAGQESRG